MDTQFKSHINYCNISILLKKIFLKPISLYEIDYIINNNKSKKSLDIYNINMKILKIANKHICHSLCYMFIIYDDIFPNKMKIVLIKPIHKNNIIFQITNYRSILILPQISRIIEKLIHSRLKNFYYLNHNILLFKLNNYDNSGVAHSLIKSYLSER